MEAPTALGTRPQQALSLDRLASVIRSSWDARTSASTAWSPGRPAGGQCAVSALVIQDYCGGELRRAVVAGESHYWNVLPDGTAVDLTRDQFETYRLDTEPELRSRSYVLSFDETKARYELLRSRVAARLGSAE